MAEKKVAKPKIELLESTSLYTVELCNPVKEKMDQIRICAPNIVFKPCSPIEKMNCIPDLKAPIICTPSWRCSPPCGPLYGGLKDWGALINPGPLINAIDAKVEELTARVDALSKKVASR